jgi:hypothetical protein
VFGWLLSLFGLRRKTEVEPIREEEAYLHSYGDRTGEVLNIEPIPEPEPEPPTSANGGLTGEFLRRAFERKLEGRKKLPS